MGRQIIPAVAVAILILAAVCAWFLLQDHQPPPSSVEDSPFGIWDSVSGYGITEPDISSMSDLGVRWEAVPVPPVFPGGWESWKSHYDKYYKNSRVTPVPMIDLIRTRNGGGLALSPADYYNSVKEIAAYFSSVDYWMLGTEMDNVYNRGLITPQQYAIYTRLTYKALKDTRQSAKLAAAGTGGTAESYEGSGFFVLVFDELEKLESIENDPSSYDWSQNPYNLTREDFDVLFRKDNYSKYMDIHHFSNFDLKYDVSYYRERTARLVGAIKNLLAAYGYEGVSLWDTQTGLHTGQPNEPRLPLQSEKQQAAGLLKKYVFSISLGVDKIFWTTTYEFNWLNSPVHYFSKVGLIYNGLGKDDPGLGVKKLSYYTYKRMVEVLEGSDWDGVRALEGTGGVYVYQFSRGNRSVWCMWNDNNGTSDVTVSGISAGRVRISEAVPKYGSGREVTGYASAFRTETRDVQNGRITLALGDVPVFVEEE